ncbi:serine hydrolase domain-containing protein [Spongiimicrobium sp. 3-5]|uniref:serine hydrolase domain-containing protein n=1 Tax=Spongiimicrobium sp. 3-5 TaxID=3332596 RepID=UPI00397F9948
MKIAHKNFIKITLLVLLGGQFPLLAQEAPHRKLRTIQKFMDDATAKNLTGLAVYIKGPKYGEWVGVSGYSDLENKVPLKPNDIFGLASIGKTYNAVAILKMVDKGKLNLDDRIRKYLPKEIIDNIPNANVVTVRHLLGHTSGFKNYNRDPKLNELYLTGNLKLDTLSHMNVLRRYGYGPAQEPDVLGVYNYSSTNYLLLSMIMDSIVPQGHATYLRQNIIAQYGLKDTYYKETPPKRLVNHYGDINQDNIIENLSAETIETTNWYSGDDGVYAPISEAAHFMEKLFAGEILSEEILKEMTTPDNDKDPDYGLGIMIDKSFPYKLLMGHSGRGIGITTDLYYFPKQQMTIGIFCNTGLRSAGPAFKKTYYKMRTKLIKKLFLL